MLSLFFRTVIDCGQAELISILFRKLYSIIRITWNDLYVKSLEQKSCEIQFSCNFTSIHNIDSPEMKLKP